jgi:hypothetical protein
MSTDSSADEKSSLPEAAPQVERPSQRIQIGSQRDSAANVEAPKPKPVTPVKDAPPKKEQKHYPPPNIRDQLSPELEAEYLAAVGEMSFNDLMESETADAPPTEIAPDTRVTGRVAKVHREDVFVDLPGRSQGVVPLRQFDAPPDVGGCRD